MGRNDVLLSLLAPTMVAGLLPPGAPPQAVNMLLERLGGQASTPSYGNPMPEGDIQQMVKRMARRKYGWTGEQWGALDDLISRESSWNPQADNPTSSAYGLFQFLDSTRDNYGIGLGASPRAQVRAGLKYVKDRYDDPLGAILWHNSHGWY